MTDVVARLWGFCHTLRHDGVDYGDYIEQITYLLFLKMADEQGVELPEQTDWPHLRTPERHRPSSSTTTTPCGPSASSPACSATSSPAARTGFSNPVNLARSSSSSIDETDWTSLEVDVKAAAFEGLLEKAASEGKKGAGQYFTPRPLIQIDGAAACSPIPASARTSRSATRPAAPAASSSPPTSG